MTMRRILKNPDPKLFDYQDHVDRLSKRLTSLDHLNEFIDWKSFRRYLRRPFKNQSHDKGGRPAFDEIFMFKILVLQRIHDLSDEQTDLAVMERLTWHRFLGVHVGCRFPNKNTIWDFRQALIEHDVFTACFTSFFKQIEARGVRLQSGKVVDATFVEVPKQRNSASENEQIKNDDVPTEWESADNKPKLRQKDTDARWTKKRGISYFGYKNHTKIDQQTKLIESCVFTQAHVHDSQVLFDLLSPGDKRLYGDAAYWSKDIAERLKEMGIQNWICEKGKRNTPLTERQMETNATKSSIRSRVEHVYGTMKKKFNGTQQRWIGFKRNAGMAIFTNLIYNMDRLRYIAGR